MALQDNARQAVQALTEILTPNGDGTVTFGAQKQPFRESQVEGLQAIQQSLEASGAVMVRVRCKAYWCL